MEGSKVIGDDADLIYRGFISKGGFGEVHRVCPLMEMKNLTTLGLQSTHRRGD